MKSKPGTFCWILVLYRPSDKLVHAANPPIEVTKLLPIRTWLLAVVTAWYPTAVALVLVPPVKSGPAWKPMAVLLPPDVTCESA